MSNSPPAAPATPASPGDAALAFEALRDVIARLLGPGGCPWDQEQTPRSLCDHLVEEAFELAEAIRAGDVDEARAELGDLAFLLCFLGALHERDGQFTLAQALETSAAKMIRRHPHVFGDATVASQEELLRNWERIKRQETRGSKRDETQADAAPPGLYDSLPRGLPPLLKAYRLHAKASRIGFTWPDTAAVQAKCDEERRELDAAIAAGDQDAMEREFGDLLFTLVEWGRRHGLKANAALALANQKFLDRFVRMEALARTRGVVLADAPLDVQDALWNEVKETE